ncbi:MAG: radical SAM protein [Lachnospiraceae bacterium]
MEEINEKSHSDILNFDLTKREQWVKERKPFSVLFELTSNCNMNCIHCYLQNSHSSDCMSYEEVISIIDILYENGIIFLTLTGGELFTRKDFKEIYLYVKKKGFLVELFTNASLVTDEIIDVFKEYPPLLVDISLYGDNEDTYYRVTRVRGMFSKVIQNCKKLVDAGIRVSLKSPILQTTLNEIDGMKKIATKMGVPFVYSFDITPTIDRSNVSCNEQVCLAISLEYEFKNYYEQVSKGERKLGEVDSNAIDELRECEYVYSCNVAKNSFVIDYKGNMLPCMKLRHKGRSLFEHSYDEIWTEFEIFGNLKASNSYKCKLCKSRYFCDICPAEMDFMYGDAQFRPNEVCLAAEIRQKFYCGKLSFEEAINEASLNK